MPRTQLRYRFGQNLRTNLETKVASAGRTLASLKRVCLFRYDLPDKTVSPPLLTDIEHKALNIRQIIPWQMEALKSSKVAKSCELRGQ